VSEPTKPWVIVPAFNDRDLADLSMGERLIVIAFFIPGVFVLSILRVVAWLDRHLGTEGESD